MVDIGTLRAKAIIDTTEVESGKNKFSAAIDGIKVKTKEATAFFGGLKGMLTELVGVAKWFGVGLLGAITGVVAASPHFQAFLMSLKGPWMQLTKFMGEHFKPLFDAISKGFKDFVNWATTNKGFKDFVDFLAKTGAKVFGIVIEWGKDALKYLFGDEKTRGLIPFIFETAEKINKKLGLEITADEAMLTILAGYLVATGHTILGTAVFALTSQKYAGERITAATKPGGLLEPTPALDLFNALILAANKYGGTPGATLMFPFAAAAYAGAQGTIKVGEALNININFRNTLTGVVTTYPIRNNTTNIDIV